MQGAAALPALAGSSSPSHGRACILCPSCRGSAKRSSDGGGIADEPNAPQLQAASVLHLPSEAVLKQNAAVVEGTVPCAWPGCQRPRQYAEGFGWDHCCKQCYVTYGEGHDDECNRRWNCYLQKSSWTTSGDGASTSGHLIDQEAVSSSPACREYGDERETTTTDTAAEAEALT